MTPSVTDLRDADSAVAESCPFGGILTSALANNSDISMSKSTLQIAHIPTPVRLPESFRGGCSFGAAKITNSPSAALMKSGLPHWYHESFRQTTPTPQFTCRTYPIHAAFSDTTDRAHSIQWVTSLRSGFFPERRILFPLLV